MVLQLSEVLQYASVQTFNEGLSVLTTWFAT
jgi:hypothetical protein